MKKITKAFTLVELIIVITILAILATIAFVSFQNYVRDARDGNRLATLKNIEKWLQAFEIKTGNYPEPENIISITASGILISKQWEIGKQVSAQIGIQTIPSDPKENTPYIYTTISNNRKYQLLTYLESQNRLSFLSQIYANDYSQKVPKVMGDNVGIILQENNEPINQTLDISTGSTNYTIIFQNNESITASGNALFSNIYNRRMDLLQNKEIAKFDESLVLYFDI